MKLTEQSAQALVNLRGNPDFTEVLKWFAENQTKFRDECCTILDFSRILQSQGKAKLVDDFFKAFGEAPATLEKFKKIK